MRCGLRRLCALAAHLTTVNLMVSCTLPDARLAIFDDQATLRQAEVTTRLRALETSLTEQKHLLQRVEAQIRSASSRGGPTSARDLGEIKPVGPATASAL